MARGKQASGLLTQQKVLRAAVALFLEKGYAKTTTAEIAAAAGIRQSSFFHVFSSKEALLLELVRRMFGGQFDLAEQHNNGQEPIFLYAVETALQLHIAELTEPLRELYVMAYTLPTTADYLYRTTSKRLQVIFADYLPDAQPKGLLRDGNRVREHHARFHVRAVRPVFHGGSQNSALSRLLAQALRCAPGEAGMHHRSDSPHGFALDGGRHHPENYSAG